MTTILPREKLLTVKLKGKQVLEPGTEFTVPFQGRFSFRYATVNPDSSLSITAWGGKGQHLAWRSFRPEDIRIHRIKKTRGGSS